MRVEVDSVSVNYEDVDAMRLALRAFLHWHDNAPCDGLVLAQAVLMARDVVDKPRPKPSEHVCGLQGFGAPGDVCIPCAVRTAAATYDHGDHPDAV